MTWDPLAAAGLGLGLGVFAGLPIGVINMAIVDAAAAGERRLATGIGIGGAIADTVHAGLAFVGIGSLIAARPAWTRALAAIAAIAIVAYAVIAWRRRKRAVAAHVHRRNGILVGVSLTLPNPASLAAWVAVAAAVWPEIPRSDALITAAGVGIGSVAWFTTLARWISSVRPDHPALRVVPRVALGVLIVIAVAGIIRVL